MTETISIQIAVEDLLSEEVVRKILASSNRKFQVTACLGKEGFGFLKKRINNYNKAARWQPFLVLTDLDNAACALSLINQWLDEPKHPNLLFRIAVREVESWVMAHRSAIAKLLGISANSIPTHPDQLADPKQALIELAKKSNRRSIRDAIVPEKNTTVKVGPGYNPVLREFIVKNWDMNEAGKHSPSLQRAIEAINTFIPR